MQSMLWGKKIIAESSTPLSLEDFIKSVRAAPTAEAERKIVAGEAANIRNDLKDERHSCTCISKLIFIQLLGHPVDVGKMECLKMLASSDLATKQMGYVGLGRLLEGCEDLLLLGTNSLKRDLAHDNVFVRGYAPKFGLTLSYDGFWSNCLNSCLTQIELVSTKN